VKTGSVVEYASNFLGDLELQLQEAEKHHYDSEKILNWLESEHSWDARLEQHLPEIEKSIQKIHAVWEENPFWHVFE
jgi:hypothetical protein